MNFNQEVVGFETVLDDRFGYFSCDCRIFYDAAETGTPGPEGNSEAGGSGA